MKSAGTYLVHPGARADGSLKGKHTVLLRDAVAHHRTFAVRRSALRIFAHAMDIYVLQRSGMAVCGASTIFPFSDEALPC